MTARRRLDQRESQGLCIRTVAGGGTPLVWIHGLGESSRCFDAIAAHPRLAGRGHALVDLPGYGRAPWAEPATIDETAALLAAWLRARGPAIVVGHSLGGVLATLVAERAPDAVRAVIDVDGNVSEGDCTFSSKIAAYGEDAFAAVGHDLLWTQLAREPDDRALRGYAASLAFADPRQVWRHAVDLVALSKGETLAARRAALAVPFTFVAGAPRGICARSRALLAAAGVPIVDVEPAGHWPFVDQPDRFADAVAATLMTDVIRAAGGGG